MMKRILLSFFILLVALSACKKQKEPKTLEALALSSFHELVNPAYLINSDSIRRYICRPSMILLFGIRSLPNIILLMIP